MASDHERPAAGSAAATDPETAAGARPSASIGAYLRLQRELREISIVQLSDRTRIPLRSLERLEAGAFDRDIDGFVRGFVRTVALALGLDADDTISRMLERPVLEAASGGRPRLARHRVLLVAAVAVGLAAVVGMVAAVVEIAGRPPREPAEREIVQRRDPVRALAESEAARAASGAVGAPPPASPATSEARH